MTRNDSKVLAAEMRRAIAIYWDSTFRHSDHPLDATDGRMGDDHLYEARFASRGTVYRKNSQWPKMRSRRETGMDTEDPEANHRIGRRDSLDPVAKDCPWLDHEVGFEGAKVVGLGLKQQKELEGRETWSPCS